MRTVPCIVEALASDDIKLPAVPRAAEHPAGQGGLEFPHGGRCVRRMKFSETERRPLMRALVPEGVKFAAYTEDADRDCAVFHNLDATFGDIRLRSHAQ